MGLEFENVLPFGAHDMDAVAAQDQMTAEAKAALRECEAFFLVTIDENGDGRHIVCGHTTAERIVALLQAAHVCSRDELLKIVREGL